MNKERTIDIAADELEFCCTATMDEIYNKLGAITYTIGTRRFGYIDRESSVIGVAHLDIAPGVKAHHGRFTRYGDRVVSPMLDDRLGLWVIAYVLPIYGVNCDILLTEDEEIGRSTAQEFANIRSEYFAEKEYNWIFQFDRAGLDCVMYDYETDKMATLIESYGWEVGFGSFSDICNMYSLGVTGFNFGTGYHNAHSLACNADLADTIASVGAFIQFYNDNHDTKYTYNEDDAKARYSRKWGRKYKSYSYTYKGKEYTSKSYSSRDDWGYSNDTFEGSYVSANDGTDFLCLECNLFFDKSLKSFKYADTCVSCEPYIDKFMGLMEKEASDYLEANDDIDLENSGVIGVSQDGKFYVSSEHDYYIDGRHWQLSNGGKHWEVVGYYDESGDYCPTKKTYSKSTDAFHWESNNKTKFKTGDRVMGIYSETLKDLGLAGQVGTIGDPGKKLKHGETWIYARMDIDQVMHPFLQSELMLVRRAE